MGKGKFAINTFPWNNTNYKLPWCVWKLLAWSLLSNFPLKIISYYSRKMEGITSIAISIKWHMISWLYHISHILLYLNTKWYKLYIFLVSTTFHEMRSNCFKLSILYNLYTIVNLETSLSREMPLIVCCKIRLHDNTKLRVCQRKSSFW